MKPWSGIQSSYVLVIFALAFLISTTPTAYADIYMYIDHAGVMHFTNAPTESDRDYKVYIREKRSNSVTFYSTDKYDDLISNACEIYGVDFRLVKAIIKAESDFNPRAVSKKGAVGLMQIMPENFQLLDIQNPFDPKENIMGGTRYFKYLYDRFEGKLTLSLAAYNAGPTTVDNYNKSIPPYRETEQYVQRVLQYYRNFKKL
ncbi:MAG: lytic transglycosylase domain-containing protein [Desulfobacterales bacterium]|nr:MAG: lytic transglycosylase domain-containing protein [Desulfobacterales bacterium]